MNEQDVPCRVSADIRHHHADLNHAEPPVAFDETDDAIMHDIIGIERLAKPVQDLLLHLRDVEAVERSFGAACVNKAEFFDVVRKTLERLREACRDQWIDIR